MRKVMIALVAVAMFGMTAGNSLATGDAARSTGSGAGGSTGAPSADTAKVIKGWSAKKMILHKAVYNENNEKIGKVEDIIVTPEDSISYAIIGVGGFLGVGEHNVAVPFSQVKMKGKNFMMSGATKEQLKQMPKFEYTKQK